MEKEIHASGSYESEGAFAGSFLGVFFGFLIGGPAGAVVFGLLGAPAGKALSQNEAERDMRESPESDVADNLAELWKNNRYPGEKNIDISFGGSYCKRTYGYSLDEKELKKPTFDVPTFSEPTFNVPTFPRPTFDIPTFPKLTFDAPTFLEPTFDIPTFPKSTFDINLYSSIEYKSNKINQLIGSLTLEEIDELIKKFPSK